uniref:Phospholipase B-like n=1 Tax=Trypanosoma congolense (strain IL3000) TaxID=1068625 RepID=F9W6R1_TRYCI|nr:unnamed protein product [Trypanosoma congolense IL3000]
MKPTTAACTTSSAALCVLFASSLFLANGAGAEILQGRNGTTVTVRYNATADTFSASADASFGEAAATLTYNDTFLESGWDIVSAVAVDSFMALPGEVEPSAERVALAYRAVGYGEGYITHDRMRAAMNNTFEGPEGLAALLHDAPQALHWIDEHLRYMEAAKYKSGPFFAQLRNMLAMLDGMVAGYNDRLAHGEGKLDKTKLLIYNMQAEIGDIVRAVAPLEVLEDLEQMMPRWFTETHCSALVKVVKDDIFFAHATWSSYNSMMRQYKTYTFGNRFVTMSSYPGALHSIDDWYMTHSRLAVMETTNVVFNKTLIRRNLDSSAVATFLRAMIANFLAEDAPSWVKYFSIENSGTYNNQWMVLNMGAVKSTAMLKNMTRDTFWVVEQLPGKVAPLGITAKDMTSVLNTSGYWASYNRPYFPNVYNLSGIHDMWKKYGDFYSYKNYSRARIFARDEGKVEDLASMKRLMRYNNYTKDPFSLIPNCSRTNSSFDDEETAPSVCKPPYSAMLSIAARGDLNPTGNDTFYGPLYRSVGHVDSAATDAKIATWSGMMKGNGTYTAHVICGPTTDGHPPFSWKKDIFNPMPPTYGLPKVYNFSFVVMTTVLPSPSKGSLWSRTGIIAIVAALVVGAIAVVLMRPRKDSEEDDALPEETEGLVDPIE